MKHTEEAKAKISKSLKGNENGLTRGAFVAALRRKVIQDPKKLDRIIDKLLLLAENGDLGAIKEVTDRLDGKAVQAQEISGPNGNPIEIEQAGSFAKELMGKLLAKRQDESDN
jgi:hypothetical protein